MSNNINDTENPMENVQTHDWNKERLEQLKLLMPDLFTNDGKLNISELKKVIDLESVNETERYEFRWFGKSNAKREAFTPTDATLVYDDERSVNPTESENLIIEGENLAVLKLLSNSYREQVKCIYIDPPYNTGKDFVYSDKFNQDKKEYWEDAEITENGFKIDTNAETDGRFHSNWLNMMYSRLLIARQLLKEDGVIFISIDDNEVHHLRKLCDDVFGEENFLGNIVWKHTEQSKNDEKYFSRQFNNIMVFRKSEAIESFRFPRTEEDNVNYSNPDNDPEGEWRGGDTRSPNYRKTLLFDITTPSGKTIAPPENGWRWQESEILSKIENREIIFSDDETRIIRKIYLKNQNGRVAENIWQGGLFGTTRSANAEIKTLFNDEVIFDTPKPSSLIKMIVNLFFNEQDFKKFLILDFFAGSGTTGQAVTELNKEDGGNRKYILVQLPETTDKKSEAYKAGYKKISDITIERNKRVVEKIIKEKAAASPDLFSKKESEQEQLKGLGFKVFKLQKSNFPRVEFAPDPEKSEEENIELLKKYIKDKEAQLVSAFNKDELITEILIKNGFKLNYTLTKQEEFKKNEILFVTDGDKETLICLDVIIADETVEHFKTHTDQKLIVLERALDTTKKWNLKHAMGDKFNAF
ncbi:MAG: site-specific DNA-methyltransferase [Bacteroidales bacterium]|jgi:adenine-specific DNA-methyltransferase|nr:site-specific DNA-methyltransferase [Bacteroidales bacterium]